ncbi:xylulokinase [Rhodococcus opacus]|uniref:Xylulose kinase n=1 Tax=Rhodococcus opacus TaxID=37919 RepID=A0A076ESZ2_RHOOP|nr:xylulokinase [Rhodococcus opacus]AII08268.1 carbohydrate kinase [Rhodococcus opacus]
MTTAARVHLGVDIGTSSCKVVAVDHTGAVMTAAVREYPLFSDRHGWSEQDPHDWWAATDACIREVTAQLPRRGDEIVAIGLSGQMHGLVALDDTGTVIRRAILWNDQRCEAECVAITDTVGGPDAVLDATANRLITGFTAGKVAWLRDHEPEAFARTHRILNPKDYLRWRMNGQFVTEVSEASGTGLFDVANRTWSPAMLAAVGVRESMLPEVVESPEPTGTLLPVIAHAWNLREDVQVYGGGGDAVVQTASMGIARPGDIGVTLGTAGIVAAVSQSCPDNVTGSVQVSCYNQPGYWHVMGVSLSAAGGLQWLADVVHQLPGAQDVSFTELIDLAKKVPVGADGLLFLPYLAGERSPHYAPTASGAMVGLTRMHGLGHLVRAVIEGALLNMRQILESFTELGIPCDRIIASGGATRDGFWLQTMADVFGTEVVTMTGSSEGGAYGAAIVAGVGAGTWESFDDAYGHLEVSSRHLPGPTEATRYTRIFEGYRNLFGHFTDVFSDIDIARKT